MNVQEIELRSGLERANIRYYEKEGLLAPTRRANGYRDYSDADLQLLLKIRLLRQLGFSLDSIRALKDGSVELAQAAPSQQEQLTARRQELDAAEQVFRQMQQDGARFPTLDARRYLDTYHAALQDGAVLPAVPETDRVRSAVVPWRRFFARALDLSMAELLVYGLLVFAFDADLSALSDWVHWLLGYLVWAVMIPLESLCISRWGATPGKAILGLSVGDEQGRPLSFGAAAERTWDLLRWGFGFLIPFYALYRNAVSYKELKRGGSPEWDWHITVEAQPMRWWRPVLYTAVTLLLAVVMVVYTVVPALPDHRGEALSTVEFVENYNQLNDRQYPEGTLGKRTLLPDGTFVRVNAWGDVLTDDAVTLDLSTNAYRGHCLDTVSYTRTFTQSSREYLPDGEGKQVLRLAIRAWMWADIGPLAALGTLPQLEQFMTHREGTLSMEVAGFYITYTIRETGETVDADGDPAISYYAFFGLSAL